MWLRRPFTSSVIFNRHLSSVRANNKNQSQEIFKTHENNPVHHTLDHSGQFYTVSEQVSKNLFSHGGLPVSFTKQTKTFAETCIMVRPPAVDIINLMRLSDMSKPANRYVLYGDKGTGKSLSLAHLIHFAWTEGYLLVHIPWVPEWLRRTTRNKEVSNSSTTEGGVDLPLEAAAWLIHFKSQNIKLLKQLQLTVSNEYIWSKRESTAIGSPLMELIDLGINRVKYSCDVIVALSTEIKSLSTQKKFKTFVAIDGYNCFFYPMTRLKTDIKKKVTPKDVTLTRAFLEFTKSDWSNAAIAVVVDQIAVPDDMHESFYPRYLLGYEGFRHLDPFVPVEVRNYSEKEMESCLGYYRDRLWLRGSSALDSELAFTSAANPYRLMELCAPL